MKKLQWLDAAKALAILGILLNHLVEEFGAGPWFTNPSEDWPDFHTRIQHIFPSDASFIVALIKFLGWLGDSGPGVFIIISGIGLSLSALRKEKSFSIAEFYRKRLFRIFPLYIAIHFIILIGLILKNGGAYPISFNTFLSILGLRFTDQLFFYLNPSWWFIWLILQLYIVFPLLFRLLLKAGWWKFLLISFIFTFLIRGAGLLDIRYSQSLYFWMTGVFFGTRLAEFSLGMVLGYLLLQVQMGKIQIPRFKTVLIFSILIYITGFLASLSYAGSIVSNVLVSAGLMGIFYCMWEGFLKYLHPQLGNILIWFGINSYALYLIHQPPMQWINYKFDGKSQFILTIAWLVVSVFLSWIINQMVENKNFLRLKIFSWKSMSAISILVLILVFTEGVYGRSYLTQRIYLLLLSGVFLLQSWYVYRWKVYQSLKLKNLLIFTGILALFLRLFILPDYHAYFAVIISV
ncbi:acyltransferase family protein, partial [candidate division KSB1 bacterium]